MRNRCFLEHGGMSSDVNLNRLGRRSLRGLWVFSFATVVGAARAIGTMEVAPLIVGVVTGLGLAALFAIFDGARG